MTWGQMVAVGRGEGPQVVDQGHAAADIHAGHLATHASRFSQCSVLWTVCDLVVGMCVVISNQAVFSSCKSG